MSIHQDHQILRNFYSMNEGVIYYFNREWWERFNNIRRTSGWPEHSWTQSPQLTRRGTSLYRYSGNDIYLIFNFGATDINQFIPALTLTLTLTLPFAFARAFARAFALIEWPIEESSAKSSIGKDTTWVNNSLKEAGVLPESATDEFVIGTYTDKGHITGTIHQDETVTLVLHHLPEAAVAEVLHVLKRYRR